MFLRVSFSMVGRSQGVSQSDVFLVYNQVRVPILRLECHTDLCLATLVFSCRAAAPGAGLRMTRRGPQLTRPAAL